MLGLPPSLPGLSFNLEGLSSFVGELLLFKVDLDIASDDRLLLCTSAAAVGLGTASSSAASSRAASRPATAASRPTIAASSYGSTGGTAVGSAGGGSVVGNTGGGSVGSAAGSSLAASVAAGPLLGAVVEDEGEGLMGGAAVRGGTAAAVAAWWSTRLRQDLEGAVFDYFLSRCASEAVVG